MFTSLTPLTLAMLELDQHGQEILGYRMFDAHRHLSDEHKSYNALYCSSHKDEWPLLEKLSPPAIGAIGALAHRALPSLKEIADPLQRNPLLQIGEIGLDKRFGDMEEQKRFLLALLDLGYSLQRSVTVHVVQSDGLFLSCLHKAGSRLPPILWHSFTGSVETARIAASKGCILSLAPGVENTRLARRLGELSTLSYAVETDYETTKQEAQSYPQILAEQYALIGDLMQLDRETLIRNNHAKRAILTNNAPPR